MQPDEYQVSCGLQERPHFVAISGKKNASPVLKSQGATKQHWRHIWQLPNVSRDHLQQGCCSDCPATLRHRDTYGLSISLSAVTFLWTWSLFCIHSYEALSFYLYSELSTAGFPDRSVCSSLEFELSRSSKDPGSLNTIYPVEGYSSPGCAGEATAEVWLKIPPRSLPTNLCCYV